MSQPINPQHIVDMALYRREERITACSGIDPLLIEVAYATEDPNLNHFGKLYRDGTPLCLHQSMADVVIDAAVRLQQTQGWRLKLFDGLRTIDAQIAMEHSADPAWYENGMLSTAGKGAHPKGMAIDLMAVGTDGKEIDVGTPFDGLDPERASRLYTGNGISEDAKQTRLMVEAAMLQAAFAQGKLLAPLRNEHWDYRFPEDLSDGWRVLESVCRVTDIPFDLAIRETPVKDYAAFVQCWQKLFEGKEALLEKTIGLSQPPTDERRVLYHGDYIPMTDKDLSASHRQCMTERYAERAKEIRCQR